MDYPVVPFPELVFCAVAISILITVTLVGNSLVLVAVARSKELQNATNVFVVNLSVSDCLASFAMLWSVPGLVSKTPGYPLQSNVPCVAAAGLVFIANGCSVLTLVNIALNRCILITRSKETYQWLYTPKKIVMMVLCSWLVTVCGFILPPVCSIGDLGFDPESRNCADVETHPRATEYKKIRFAIFYPLPFMAIIASYLLIWCHVRRHFKKRRQYGICMQSVGDEVTVPSSASRLDDDNAPDDSGTQSHIVSFRRAQSSRHLSRPKSDQLAITKNLFVVVFAFSVCFTPIAVMALTTSRRYRLYAALLWYVHSCITPIIYAAKHPHFKPVLRSMIRCRCSNGQEVRT